MEHRVYIGLTKPIMFLGIPISIFAGEAVTIATLYIVLKLPIWFIAIAPFVHLFLVYLTLKDYNWYKVALIKSKYFTKGRSFKKGRIRYNA